jgi:hypothetical protein
MDMIIKNTRRFCKFRKVNKFIFGNTKAATDVANIINENKIPYKNFHRVLTKFFRLMNEILDSNLTKKSKLDLLDIVNENSFLAVKRAKIHKRIVSYLYNLIHLKYKTTLKEILKIQDAY